MKNVKIFILFLLLLYSVGSFAQEGKVNKYFGKSIFWYSEPVSEYTVVFQVKLTFYANQRQFAQSEAGMKETIINSVQQGNKDFDALVIVQNSTYDLAIKFKDSAADKVSCKAPKINGIPVLIDATPNEKYKFKQKQKFKRGRPNGSFIGSLAIAKELTKKPKGDLLVIDDDFEHSWFDD
jgi:hypothetical protein